jgi:hypothetical protein
LAPNLRTQLERQCQDHEGFGVTGVKKHRDSGVIEFWGL